MRRGNLTAFVCGMKGTGKSRLLADLFTARAPRVLSLDPNGEVRDTDPRAVTVAGWPALLDMLSTAAEYDRWHIAAALDDADIPRLFALLAPESVLSGTGLSRALGGVAVVCGEVDTVAPNGRTPREVKSAWKRGRHHLLSLYAATQRPSETDRIVSSQADHLIAFRMNEPRDLEYVARATSPIVARECARLDPYWCAWYDRATAHVTILDPGRVVVRRHDLFGVAADAQLTAP